MSYFKRAVDIADELDSYEVWQDEIHTNLLNVSRLMYQYARSKPPTNLELSEALYELEISIGRIKRNMLWDFDYEDYKKNRAKIYVQDNEAG